MANDTSVMRVPRRRVTCVHLLFDAHEVVLAEGAPCESLAPTAAARAKRPFAQRRELDRLFGPLTGALTPLRPMLDRYRAQLLT
ncbi:MAG: Hint domain-containing protein [Pseudomonadota bacterium]